MEQLKASLETLRQSLARLEMAIETDRARRIQTETRATELQQALRIAHDRLDNALTTYRQGGS